MSENLFFENVKPGGLTTSTETRILICYLLGAARRPITRQQMEEALLGEELANYFILADSLAHLVQQGLVEETDGAYSVTERGATVGSTLAVDVPLSIREAAARAVIRAQQFTDLQSTHKTAVAKAENGYSVQCRVEDETGALLDMQLFLPDQTSADAVAQLFTKNGDSVYKLILSALTQDAPLAERTIKKMRSPK